MSARASRRRSRRAAANAPVAAAERRPGAWITRIVGALLLLFGVVPMANLVTDGPGLPWWSAAVRQWAVGAAVVIPVALVLGRRFPSAIERAYATLGETLLRPSSRKFAAATGALAFALALSFGWYLFRWRPAAGDEFSQLWQARILTSGHLFATSTGFPAFFGTPETLDANGRWFSQFPIGGPAILALGMATGATWLVNPILTAVVVIASYRFVATAMDERTARVCALLLALCPFLLFMGASQMNHTSALACTAVALAALAAWRGSGGGRSASRRASLVGFSLGLAATIRPFDAAIAGAAIALFQLREATLRPELRRSLAWQVAAGLVPVLALLLANGATVGDPFTFGYDALHGPEHRPGFHVTPLGFAHTPRRGLYMVSAYLMKLDVGLLGWPVPAILLVAAVLLLVPRASRWDRLLLGILTVTLVGYGVYWGESYFLGPRYLFNVVPILVLYIARLPGVLRERTESRTLRASAALLIPLWLLGGWLMPAGDGQVASVRSLASSYRVKGSEAGTLHADAQRDLPPRSLVFVDDGWHSRLTARLRAIGTRPLVAERIVSSADACSIQQALEVAEQNGSHPDQRAEALSVMLGRDAPAAPVPGLTAASQLAFVPGRALSADCQKELGQPFVGVALEELLPYESLDRDGTLGGQIVYARDFGARNELLRPRFGNRAWFVAHRREYQGRVEFRFVPYQHSAR